MILICGIPSEDPLALVAAALERNGAAVSWFDQRGALGTTLDLAWRDDGLAGCLVTPQGDLALESVGAVYTRLMDDRALPDVEALPAESPTRRHVRAVHERLAVWLEATPAMVVNRASAQASNASKPLQAQLIAEAGFAVPETLITSDPAAVLAFRARHGRIIYKSISAARSVVKVFTDLDAERLDRIRWCPVQFQAYVEGTDVRVHVVGDEVFAARVTSWAADYRYSDRSNAPDPLVEPMALEADVADRCRRLTGALGLELAGIDLRQTPAGEWVCFEVNPSPAFSYYEARTGAPIAAAIARHLIEADTFQAPSA